MEEILGTTPITDIAPPIITAAGTIPGIPAGMILGSTAAVGITPGITADGTDTGFIPVIGVGTDVRIIPAAGAAAEDITAAAVIMPAAETITATVAKATL